MDSFITKIENDMFQVLVDLKLYTKEALTATIYKYTGSYYVHQQLIDENENMVKVVFESMILMKDNVVCCPMGFEPHSIYNIIVIYFRRIHLFP